MNTKEAIEKTELELAIDYLKQLRHDQWKEYGYINQAVPIIIEKLQLFQQGEKYKIIIEELKKEYGNGILENDYGIGVQLFNLIEILEQKYFPKETNEHKEGNE